MVFKSDRKPIRALAAFLFALTVCGIGVTPWPARAGNVPKLLLLPIVVHSAEDPEYVRAGLADMLTARFARIGGLELVRPTTPLVGTTDFEQALKLGRKADADFVLFGSFTRFGQGASLDVQCSPTGEAKNRKPLREIFVHSGSIGEIIPDLDELAGKVSRFAKGENVAATPLGPIPSGTANAASSAPPDQNLADLLVRIDALEASVTQLLEAQGEAIGDGAIEGDEAVIELR